MLGLFIFSLWINAGNIFLAYINVKYEGEDPDNMPEQPLYVELIEMVVTFPAVMTVIMLEHFLTKKGSK